MSDQLKTTPVVAIYEINLEEMVAGGTTDQEFDFQIPIGDVVSMHLRSNRDVLIKTNDTIAPRDMISLIGVGDDDEAAGIVWRVGCSGDDPPFSGDVTKLFITNHGTETAAIKLSALCR